MTTGDPRRGKRGLGEINNKNTPKKIRDFRQSTARGGKGREKREKVVGEEGKNLLGLRGFCGRENVVGSVYQNGLHIDNLAMLITIWNVKMTSLKIKTIPFAIFKLNFY